MKMSLNMLKKNYLSVLLVVVGTGLVLFLLTKFLGRENFESGKS